MTMAVVEEKENSKVYDEVTVLVTGVGAPGTIGTIYSLKSNWDRRRIRIIGTDIKAEVYGKYLVDAFYVINPPSAVEAFLLQLFTICESEGVQVILPQCTAELPVLAKYRDKFEQAGIKIAVNHYETIEILNHKGRFLLNASDLGVNTPEYYMVDSMETFNEASKLLGFPDQEIIFKPPISHGSIGFRILTNRDPYNLWYSEKPTSQYVTKAQMEEIFKDKEFPELLVMEYLPGLEYSVDVLILPYQYDIIIPRKRLDIRNGITYRGETIRYQEIRYDISLMVEKWELRYLLGFQFIDDDRGTPRLIECNPRIQGTMIHSTFAGVNMIYAAVKLLLCESMPFFKIQWGIQYFRDHGGFAVFDDNNIKAV